MTRMFCALSDWIRASAKCSPYRKPTQAAPMSEAAARVAPRFFWTRQEVAGNGMSPEIVPTRIMSRSSGLTCERFKAMSAAFVQRSENFSPSETMWRSLIPVRSVIHWSLVSTIFSRSALVRSFFGTAAPVLRILARFMSTLHSPRFARVKVGDRGLDLLGQALSRELRGEADRVLDRLGARPAVADDDAPLETQERRAPVLGVVEAHLEPPEGAPGEEEADGGLQGALDLLAQELLDHLGQGLGDFQDDAAGEAVPPLDVADEVQARLLQGLEGFLRAVVPLGVLLADGHETD